jgi:hypothetical protein
LTYTPKPKYIQYRNYTTASIELESLLVSSSEIWLLDSSAEISMKKGYIFEKQRHQPSILHTPVIRMITLGLEGSSALQRRTNGGNDSILCCKRRILERNY